MRTAGWLWVVLQSCWIAAHAQKIGGACTGASTKLDAVDCAAWTTFFDATGGKQWSECSSARTDPCSCNAVANANISCGCKHRMFQPPCTPVIEAVRLSGVGLRGDIAAAWGSLSTMDGLRQLDVSDNQLSGSIPDGPMLNTDMNYLDVSANKLSGDIPAKLGDLTDVSYLNMSRNTLSGGVKNIAKMTDVTHLDLSSNRFTGPVPYSVQCGMTIVQHVDLSFNSFSGSIPIFICGVAKLMETMHVEHNTFNSIPDQFAEMTAMTALYAHGNRLSGVVPQNIAGLAGLSALRLDGNGLNGTLPPLPFAGYTAYCALDSNAFACPLPKGASDCKQGPPTCK